MKVLVTGATGFLGSRLVPALLKRGHAVRAASRSLERLKQFPWFNEIEPAIFDVQEAEEVEAAVKGCDVVYYLIHSMVPDCEDFETRDRRMADIMCTACSDVGVKRIVYMGGLGDTHGSLSAHLRSRHEVADRLSNGKALLTVLRAAMVLGSGSASFLMLKYLVDRTPILLTPSWVRTKTQPIAVDNVIHYLVEVLQKEETVGKRYDIGGPEVMSYQGLMLLYARVVGLRRLVLPLPFFMPKMSAWWIGLTTPVDSCLVLPLIHGLDNPTVCEENALARIVPQKLFLPEEAIRRALDENSSKSI